MTPEDPKQADQVAKSPDGREPNGKGDELAASSPAEHAKGLPIAVQADSENVDRWNDSDIDAAVGVLERPSQIPPSVRGPTEPGADAEERASLTEPRSVRLSASAVEKSKRAGSDPPLIASSTAPLSEAAKAAATIETAADALAREAASVDGQATLNHDGGDDAIDEATAYFDRPLAFPDPPSKPQAAPDPADNPTKYSPDRAAMSESEDSSDAQAIRRAVSSGEQPLSEVLVAPAPRSTTDVVSAVKPPPRVPRPEAKPPSGETANVASPAKPSSNVAGTHQSARSSGVAVSGDRATSQSNDSDDVEEATSYFDRSALSKTDQSEPAKVEPTKVDEEVEEATQFFDRSPASRPIGDAQAEIEEPTSYFERPSLSAGRQAGSIGLTGPDAARMDAAAPSPDQTSDHLGRPSSVSLVGLLAAETTEPPPVAVVGAKVLPTPPRAKASPPRPAGMSGPPQYAKAELEKAPLSVTTGDVPTRHEGRPNFAQAVPGVEQSAAGNSSARTVGANSAAVGDTEPLSERFHEAPGGEIDPPTQGLTGITAFSIAARPGSPGFEEEVWLDPIFVRFWRRLVRAAASCSIAGVPLALVDAWYAHSAALNPPALWLLVLACHGLVVPLALLLAVVVAGMSMLLHPDSAPSLGRLPHKLRPLDIRRQARLAVILGVAPLAICSWLMLVARAALPLLGSNAAPPVVGTLLAAVAVGLGLLVAAPVLAVARYVGVRLRQNPPDPVRWGLVGLVIGIAPLALAIITGPTSGAGSVFAIFGVFKRPELDLRAPCLLLGMGLAGYLLPAQLKRIPLIGLILGALLPLGLTVRVATRGLDNRAVALAVERGAPTSRIAYGTLRRAFDRDHDGFSKYFGGGDCDDQDRQRNPGADDLPDNGIDEDCSGTDAAPVMLKTTLATPVELLQARRGVIPKDLNVIFIIVDTMRADVLRHTKRVTPRLDELADKSVTVERAYAPASYTGKSVGPILIGKHSSETNRDFGHFAAFSRKDTFLQQRLHSAGIRTLSVQGYWYFTQPFYGFDRGFDVVDSGASVSAGYVEGDRSTTSEKLTERILWQLDQPENTSGRFFLWSQYTDPHAEYVTHAGFDLGSDMLGRYHGEVAFVDYHIGRIVDFVRSKPWGARTAIVVTSDHGEAFGEHGMIRHGFELWEALVQVPLLFHVPGVEPRQVRSRRSLIDVTPTILDLMQLQTPEGDGSDFLSGRSLLPELLGIDGSDVSRPVLVDMANGPYTAERQAYIDGDIKLITALGRPLGLFDLSSDPEEKHDLLDNAELRERVVGEYRAFKKAMHVIDVRPSKP